MLSDAELQEIEGAAVELARGAGKLLLDYFAGPLTIDYKSENSRNPVTDADHAADEYLRTEIARRFPSHGIVTEESKPDAETRSDVVWVVDPLDGTSNFLNGLPVFAVLIGVLKEAKPVACAIFIPDIRRPEGRVLHARAGGGAYDEEDRLSLAETEEPRRRMSTWPTYFLRMYEFRKQIRRQLGDVRSIGSAGYELAMAGRGVFDYVVFNGPWSWDLAAGVMLIQEAGGAVLQYDRKSRTWRPFDRFAPDPGVPIPTPAEIAKWRGALILGRPSAVTFITSGLRISTYRWRRLRAKLVGLLRRPATPPSPQPEPATPTDAATGELQSQGQGTSRRE